MAPRSAAALSAPPTSEAETAADPDYDEAWDRELDRRIAEVREGRVQCIPWEEVQAKARAILGPRPKRAALRRTDAAHEQIDRRPEEADEGPELAHDDEIAEEWEAEIERRAEDIRSGRVAGVPWEQVEAEISAKYGWA